MEMEDINILSRNDTALCAYLNLTIGASYADMLIRLDALFANVTLPERLLITPIMRQWKYAKCGQEFILETLSSRLMSLSKLLPGAISPFIPQVVVPGILTLIAVCFNISIIMVTFKHIKDHTVSNWLLAFDALCQLLATSLFLANFIAALLGVAVLNFGLCLVISFVSTSATFASFMTIYLISLERLLITMAPLRMNLDIYAARKFSLLAVFLAIFFGLAMNNYALVPQDDNLLKTPLFLYNLGGGNSRLYCDANMFGNKLKGWTSFAILLLTVLNYGLIFARLLWRRLRGVFSSSSIPSSNAPAVPGADKFIHQMLRTLFILTIAIVVGWMFPVDRVLYPLFIKYVLPYLFNLFGGDSRPSGLLLQESALFQNISYFAAGFQNIWTPILASASGVPILFFSSTSYRTAYKKLLKGAMRITPSNSDHRNNGNLFAVRHRVETTGITTMARQETQMANNGGIVAVA